MTGKMTITRTFKADEEFDDYLGQLSKLLPDYSVSHIIRQAVLIAGPFLIEHPECAKNIGIPKPKGQ
jgi:hypothetical protein